MQPLGPREHTATGPYYHYYKHHYYQQNYHQCETGRTHTINYN